MFKQIIKNTLQIDTYNKVLWQQNFILCDIANNTNIKKEKLNELYKLCNKTYTANSDDSDICLTILHNYTNIYLKQNNKNELIWPSNTRLLSKFTHLHNFYTDI